jgi:hypothetical protein
LDNDDGFPPVLREMEGDELDGEDMVLVLNGFKLGRRMGRGLAVVAPVIAVVLPVVVVGGGTFMLPVKNGPWLTIELEGDDELSDNLRCRGEFVGEGVVLWGGCALTLSLRNLANGSLGDPLIPPPGGTEVFAGRMNLSAILSLGSLCIAIGDLVAADPRPGA